VPNVKVDESHVVRLGAPTLHSSLFLQKISNLPSMQQVEHIGLGGAGNKCLAVVEGRADAYISNSLQYWDFAGPEALIKGMGGYTTNFLGQKLAYPVAGDTYFRGMVCARTPEMHRFVYTKDKLAQTLISCLKKL